jgi:competence protein ComEC
MTPSLLFLVLSLSFVVGIFLGFYLSLVPLFWLGFFVLFFVLFVFLKGKRLVLVFIALFLIFGFLRANYFKSLDKKSISKNFYNREVVLSGRVIEEPKIKQGRQNLVVRIEYLNGKKPKIKEKAIIIAGLYPLYQYGDRLEIKGRAKKPSNFDDFDYQEFLAQKRIYSIFYYPEISSLYQKNKNPLVLFYKKILVFKNFLRENIDKSFSYPQNFLLRAMILGDKQEMPKELKEELNIAGIRHITAISGMHIIILLNILLFLFLGLGLSKNLSFYLVIIFISLFVLMIGLQPSAIRAALFGFLSLLAQRFGRLRDFSRAVVFVAALMLFFDPFLLKEVGFQLSFLAVMGINYLMPAILSKLQFLKKLPQTKNILAMSLAAYVFTLPVLVYNFGYLSLVSPFCNLFVVPVLPYLIALGLLSALFGGFSFGLIFVFPCWLLLTYIIKTADIFSSFSFASINLKISLIWLFLFYLFLSYFIWQKRRETRFKIVKV